MKKTNSIPVIVFVVIFTAFVFILKGHHTEATNPNIPGSHDNISEYQYLKLYSGGYFVNSPINEKTKKSEMYILDSSGKAEWSYVEFTEGKIKIISHRHGIWEATRDAVIINVKGKIGHESEKFSLENDTLRNGQRYLVYADALVSNDVNFSSNIGIE